MKKLVVSLLVAFSCCSLLAQNGILDTSFGNQGHVIKSFNPFWCSGMTTLFLPDSKIVVGGFSGMVQPQFKFQGLLHRYNSDGTVDSSFAVNGEVDSNLLASNWIIMKLALQADGKIMAIGFYDFTKLGMLARFMPNGDLDSSFGTNGVTIIDYSTTPLESTTVVDGAILADGKIVICGEIYAGNLPQNYVSRYTAAGNLDSSFGTSGVKKLPLTNNYEFSVRSMQVQPDDKILLCGYSYVWPGDHMMVVRLLSNGNFDPTFGINGIVRHALFERELSQKILLLPNQKILCMGSVGLYDTAIFAIQLLLDGNIDSSYGTNGMVTLNVQSTYNNWVTDSKLLPDNSVLVSIQADSAAQTEFVIARVLEGGQADVSFGTNGFIHSDFPNESGYNSIAIVDDGSFLASGYVSDTTGSSLLLSKYVMKSYFSIEEPSLPKTDFKIYPNPSSGTLTISTKNPGIFALYNAMGQQVWRGKINLEPLTLNLQHLPAGLYFMVDEKGASQKIILRK